MKKFLDTLNRRKVLAAVVGFFILIFFLKVLDGFIQLPPDVKKFVTKIIPSRQFHKLVVMEPFSFEQKGFARTYLLNPRYMDVFTVGFFSVNGELPSNYVFNGKIKMEYSWGPKMRFEQLITSGSVTQPLKQDVIKRRKVVLKNFDLRLRENYNDNIKITLTVLSADPILKKYKGALRVYIEVKRTQ